MLTIDRLGYQIGGRVLFEAASARIAGGQRVGLVGRNGAGKSTLLRLICGELHPDSGSIEVPTGTRTLMLEQEAPGGEETPLDAVLAADAERAELLAEAQGQLAPERLAEIHARLEDLDAHAAPARAAGILAGLGFDAGMQAAPLSSLSGGWRMRVALAAVLFAEPELLLLDEPTNHLDLEAALWLEEYLARYPRTLIIASHDRRLLNTSVSHILHLDEARLTLYSGGFDRFVTVREERRVRAEELAAKRRAEREHIQAFVDRFRYKASKARQAQSKLKALERLPPLTDPTAETAIAFGFPAPEELKPPLLRFQATSVGYAPGRPILRRLDLRLDPDDRIALLGANGNGKSTLARLLAGRLEAEAGEAMRAPRLRVGYFAQHQIEDMDGAATPFLALSRLMKTATPEAVRARLGRFGFSQDAAEVKIRNLSGGERARLNFALISHDAPHILILDEPTNHLDLPAREALVDALNAFPGAVVLISHDWHLVERVADRLWLVADGTAAPFEGDLDDYRRAVLAGRGEARGESTGITQRKQARREAAERRRQLEPLRRRALAAEAELTKLTEARAAVDGELARPETHSDGQKVATLGRRRAELSARIAAAEELWLEVAAAFEDAMAAD